MIPSFLSVRSTAPGSPAFAPPVWSPAFRRSKLAQARHSKRQSPTCSPAAQGPFGPGRASNHALPPGRAFSINPTKRAHDLRSPPCQHFPRRFMLPSCLLVPCSGMGILPMSITGVSPVQAGPSPAFVGAGFGPATMGARVHARGSGERNQDKRSTNYGRSRPRTRKWTAFIFTEDGGT